MEEKRKQALAIGERFAVQAQLTHVRFILEPASAQQGPFYLKSSHM